MSRLGKIPINLPSGTQARLEENFLIISGPKGELKQKLHNLIKLEIADNNIKVTTTGQDKQARSLWGLFRSLIKNMVVGVNQEYEKKLEINGIGYRAAVSGDKLTLNIGFSHPVIYQLPAGIKATIETSQITISGIDKQLVGDVAAQIRKIRKPEPYKGKGIKYIDEVIRRKAGKTAAKTEK